MLWNKDVSVYMDVHMMPEVLGSKGFQITDHECKLKKHWTLIRDPGTLVKIVKIDWLKYRF